MEQKHCSDYEVFIRNKRHTEYSNGIEVNFIPDTMFDFQEYVSKIIIEKGRHAGFLDTGLGKTIIELTAAQNYTNNTQKPVLIITPLAVAHQFIGEAEKFGIKSIQYSKDGTFDADVVICNYERLSNFDSSMFDCVILDESSILKNFEGQIKSQINEFMKHVKYRFLFTATPSPNDCIELGTSSEALGFLGYTDMLTRFFKNNNNSIDIRHAGCEWYLKPHAEMDFWKWVASWSTSMRKPSDLGFSDERHTLPNLNEIQTVVQNKNPLSINGQGQLFANVALNFNEIKAEVRATINERCEVAVDKAKNHETTVYWVNRNDEAETILNIDRSAFEVNGKMSIDEKEEILIAFQKGEIKKLITKPSITGFGLNWQHCNHTTYFPTYSYEQYYQAIRRFWRFGQKREVFVDLVLSDGQSRIIDSLTRKKDKAFDMFENLVKNSNSDFSLIKSEYNNPIQLPTFLKK